MQNSLITIGITCHNAADTIVRAVASALAQDWPAIEIIVVDDCSTDGSWEALQEAARRDERMRIFRHELNKGYPGALNTIMANAKGELVAIFDDDDDNVPDRLTTQRTRILDYERRTGAQLVFCYANRNIIRTGRTEVDHVALAIGRKDVEPHGRAVADYLLSVDADPRFVWGIFGSCTLMARRSTFLAVGKFDEAFRRCAEWDMAIRGALIGAHFIAVDRPLITQYKTPSLEKAGAAPLKYSLMLRVKYRPYLAERGLYWASMARGRANFYGNKKRIWKARFFQLLSYVLHPALLVARVKRMLAVGGRA